MNKGLTHFFYKLYIDFRKSLTEKLKIIIENFVDFVVC